MLTNHTKRTPHLVALLCVSMAVAPTTLAAFPDAHNAPPNGWTGPVFKLSQSYPTTLPPTEPAASRPWTQFDFKNPAQASSYLQAVLSYCLEGNTANNFADVSQNAVRTWYHVPWLHSGPSGREFIHGLTKERTSRVGELGPAQTHAHDNWAVGFYNPRGGFISGQVWQDATEPDPRKAVFPADTVACKLLFTTAPLSEVPFLQDSLAWQADVNRSIGSGSRPTLHLLQLDVAVRDSRADSTTGWVFGTFQYEKDASPSANWWEHMVPVGLMWGSDVTRLKANQPTQEEWINTSRGQKLHLGRKNLVLNGPIDNPAGSCTACHGFAQIPRFANATPPLPAGPPAATTTGAPVDRYFTNIKPATPLSPNYIPVDYSLQLQLGIARAVSSGQAHLPGNINAIGGRAGAAPKGPRQIPEVTRQQ